MVDGAKILRETWDGNTLVPLYDNEDSVCGIVYNEVPYYFQKNLQGDVIGITDENGTVVAEYVYDAWGKVIDISGCDACIAQINPFRYRGYYYDQCLQLYYLQSRYYDPKTGRFINADMVEIILLAELCADTNLFAYCGNDPNNYFDLYGLARWLINIKITKALTFVVDLAIVALFAFLTCLVAVKLKYKALKIVSWLSKNSIKKKLKNLITKIAQLIVGAIHTVVYTIADTVPKWALSISATAIAGVLLDYIELSAAEILLSLLDRYDGDGKSGFIRYIKV